MSLFQEIDPAKIKAVKETAPKSGPFPPPPQNGPWRFHDRTMTCSSPGCGTWCYYTVQGEPLCGEHVIRKLNEMLIELGVEC